jgi:predicted  nucleic acid-binding Zn-ribbon protein
MKVNVDANEIVSALLDLQNLDNEIGSRTLEVELLNERLVELEEKLPGLESRVSETSAAVEEAEEMLRRRERTVQAGRATYKRLQGRAQEVQNMRQHLAARAESDAARRNLEIAEEEVLEAMQRLEQSKVNLQEFEAELTEARGEFDAGKAEVDTRKEELEGEIAVRRDKRENRAIRLDDSVVQLYEKVRGGRTQDVLALLVDGVCGHCFTSVPLQRQSEIKAGRTLWLCEGCGVILHAGDLQ